MRPVPRGEWNRIVPTAIEPPTGFDAYFGPFLGEFGWESMYWQGWCRLKWEELGRPRSLVMCRPGREGFYEWASGFFWPYLEDLPVCDYHGPAVSIRPGSHTAPGEARYLFPLHRQKFVRPKRGSPQKLISVLFRGDDGSLRYRDKAWYSTVLSPLISAGWSVEWLESSATVSHSIETLSKSSFCIGPEGGGCKLALLTATPLVSWGTEREGSRMAAENIFGSLVDYRDEHVSSARITSCCLRLAGI